MAYLDSGISLNHIYFLFCSSGGYSRQGSSGSLEYQSHTSHLAQAYTMPSAGTTLLSNAILKQALDIYFGNETGSCKATLTYGLEFD